eukprot:60784-Pyramimonas_sp.AAC.1
MERGGATGKSSMKDVDATRGLGDIRAPQLTRPQLLLLKEATNSNKKKRRCQSLHLAADEPGVQGRSCGLPRRLEPNLLVWGRRRGEAGRSGHLGSATGSPSLFRESALGRYA